MQYYYRINSQITKARDNNHIKYNLFNSFTTINMKWLHSIMFEKRKVKFISKLVGISEAIRLILVFLNLNIISLNSFIFPCHTSLATEGLLNKPSVCYTQTTNILPYTSCCIAVAKHPGQGVVDNTITHARADTDASQSQLNTLNFNEWLAGLIDGDGYFFFFFLKKKKSEKKIRKKNQKKKSNKKRIC